MIFFCEISIISRANLIQFIKSRCCNGESSIGTSNNQMRNNLTFDVDSAIKKFDDSFFQLQDKNLRKNTQTKIINKLTFSRYSAFLFSKVTRLNEYDDIPGGTSVSMNPYGNKSTS